METNSKANDSYSNQSAGKQLDLEQHQPYIQSAKKIVISVSNIRRQQSAQKLATVGSDQYLNTPDKSNESPDRSQKQQTGMKYMKSAIRRYQESGERETQPMDYQEYLKNLKDQSHSVSGTPLSNINSHFSKKSKLRSLALKKIDVCYQPESYEQNQYENFSNIKFSRSNHISTLNTGVNGENLDQPGMTIIETQQTQQTRQTSRGLYQHQEQEVQGTERLDHFHAEHTHEKRKKFLSLDYDNQNSAKELKEHKFVGSNSIQHSPKAMIQVQQKSRQKLQSIENQDSLTNVIYQLNLGNLDYIKSKQNLIDRNKQNIQIKMNKRVSKTNIHSHQTSVSNLHAITRNPSQNISVEDISCAPSESVMRTNNVNSAINSPKRSYKNIHLPKNKQPLAPLRALVPNAYYQNSSGFLSLQGHSSSQTLHVSPSKKAIPSDHFDRVRELHELHNFVNQNHQKKLPRRQSHQSDLNRDLTTIQILEQNSKQVAESFKSRQKRRKSNQESQFQKIQEKQTNQESQKTFHHKIIQHIVGEKLLLEDKESLFPSITPSDQQLIKNSQTILLDETEGSNYQNATPVDSNFTSYPDLSFPLKPRNINILSKMTKSRQQTPEKVAVQMSGVSIFNGGDQIDSSQTNQESKTSARQKEQVFSTIRFKKQNVKKTTFGPTEIMDHSLLKNSKFSMKNGNLSFKYRAKSDLRELVSQINDSQNKLSKNESSLHFQKNKKLSYRDFSINRYEKYTSQGKNIVEQSLHKSSHHLSPYQKYKFIENNPSSSDIYDFAPQLQSQMHLVDAIHQKPFHYRLSLIEKINSETGQRRNQELQKFIQENETQLLLESDFEDSNTKNDQKYQRYKEAKNRWHKHNVGHTKIRELQKNIEYQRARKEKSSSQL